MSLRDLFTSARDRLTLDPHNGAVAVHLNAAQEQFYQDARGFWAIPGGADRPATQLRRHADGTVDAVRLQPSLTLGGYVDLGGTGGRDVAVGRA